MPVFVLYSYLIVEGKEKEHDEALKKFIQHIMEHREKYGMMKSVRSFVHDIGGEYGRRVNVEEFESISDYDKYRNTAYADEKFMQIHDELMPAFDRKTLEVAIWKEVLPKPKST